MHVLDFATRSLDRVAEHFLDKSLTRGLAFAVTSISSCSALGSPRRLEATVFRDPAGYQSSARAVTCQDEAWIHAETASALHRELFASRPGARTNGSSDVRVATPRTPGEFGAVIRAT